MFYSIKVFVKVYFIYIDKIMYINSNLIEYNWFLKCYVYKNLKLNWLNIYIKEEIK